jgi:hypothetical protein
MDDRRLTYDVVVAGGGSAGLAAAIGAASAGARVALVERYGFLGGMATAGMVSTVCGLYHTTVSGEPRLVNEGVAATVASRLPAMPGCAGPVRRGRTFVLAYTPFAFACLADDLVAEAQGIDVYLHAYLSGVSTTGRRVDAVVVTTWEKVIELAARTVVDTSGDAVAAHRAGAETEIAPIAERQLASLVFVLQGVDTSALGQGARAMLLRALMGAEREGRLPKGASNLTLAPSPQPGEVVCKLALGGITEELPHGRSFLTVAEGEGRRRARAVTDFLKSMPPFERAFISHAAPQVGVRESRRITGRYTLTREDVLAGRKFDDGVARAGWPIELWEEGKLGATYEYLEDGATYDIPLRCLRARTLDNLYMAGRCLSATREALGSARVIGTCLATGEAAGIAAARSANERGAP